MIKTIQELFNLTEQNIETNIFEYLEIEFTFEDFKMTMRQYGFIKKFKTTEQNNFNRDKTPANFRPLGADLRDNDFIID